MTPYTNCRGFTTVEVLVAAMIALVAVGAVGRTFAGTSRAQTIAQAKARQSGALQSVWEQVHVSKESWIDRPDCVAATASTPCDLSPLFTGNRALADADGTPMFGVRARAFPVRGAAPGTPNEYSVTVAISSLITNLTLAPLTTAGKVSSLRTGVLELRTCRLDGQVDERRAISVCPTPNDVLHLLLPGEDVSLGNLDSGSPDTILMGQDNIVYEDADGIHHGMMKGRERQAVYESSSRSISTTGVDTSLTDYLLSPLPIAFTLSRLTPGPGPSEINGTTGPTGVTMLYEVPAGRYAISYRGVPDELVPWESHSTPGAGTIVIEAGEHNTALQAFQPRAALDFVIRLESQLITKTYDAEGTLISVDRSSPTPGLAHDINLWLIPAPFGRLNISDDAVRAPAGSFELVIPRPLTGLYLGDAFVFRSGRDFDVNRKPVHDLLAPDGTKFDFIWIDEWSLSLPEYAIYRERVIQSVYLEPPPPPPSDGTTIDSSSDSGSDAPSDSTSSEPTPDPGTSDPPPDSGSSDTSSGDSTSPPPDPEPTIDPPPPPPPDPVDGGGGT